MTPQQIVALFVRLFSIWLALMTIQLSAVFTLSNLFPEERAWLVWAIPVIPLACAILAWKFPMTIANKLVKHDDDNVALKLPAQSAAAVGTAILGMWAVLNSVPHVWGTILMQFMMARDGMLLGNRALGPSGMGDMGFVILAVLGLWMTVKPWTIARQIFPDEHKGAQVTEQTAPQAGGDTTE